MSTEFESRVCEIAATFNTFMHKNTNRCNSFYAMAQHLMSLITIFVCLLFTELCPNTHQYCGDVKKSTFGGWKEFNTHTRDQS